MEMIKALLSYRSFIFGMVKQDFRARYAKSMLGRIWAIIDPLSMIFIYTVIFSQVMRAKLPGINDGMSYSIFLCAGLLTWGFFVEVITRSQNMFIAQANLIKKSSFPRATLPVIVLFSALINFAIVLVLFIIFLIFTGRFVGWPIFYIIPLLIVQQAMAVGLGLIFGTLNVFFRDVGQFIGIVLQFWFWFTPIVYTISIVPDLVKDFQLYANPIAKLVIAYQNIFLTGTPPIWKEFIPHLSLACLFLGLGFFVYKRMSGEMMDEL